MFVTTRSDLICIQKTRLTSRKSYKSVTQSNQSILDTVFLACQMFQEFSAQSSWIYKKLPSSGIRSICNKFRAAKIKLVTTYFASVKPHSDSASSCYSAYVLRYFCAIHGHARKEEALNKGY